MVVLTGVLALSLVVLAVVLAGIIALQSVVLTVSGESYKRHVALDNLLSSAEYGIDRAYVLSEANVPMGQRNGGTVWYLPRYMLPLVAEEAKRSNLDLLPQGDGDISWEGLLERT